MESKKIKGSVKFNSSYNVTNDVLTLQIKLEGEVFNILKACCVLTETTQEDINDTQTNRYKIRRVALGSYGLRSCYNYLFTKELIDNGVYTFEFSDTSSLKNVIDQLKTRIPDLLKNYLEATKNKEYVLNVEWDEA